MGATTFIFQAITMATPRMWLVSIFSLVVAMERSHYVGAFQAIVTKLGSQDPFALLAIQYLELLPLWVQN
jgi:hypothetical protein